MSGDRLQRDTEATGDFVMPAEFEPHAAIWMGWPKGQSYADPDLDTRVPIAQIIDALCAHGIDVKLMCTDEPGEREVQRWLGSHGYPVTDRLDFVHIDQIDIWVRDYGPIFTRNRANRLGMASFLQSQWGYAATSDPVSRAMTELPERVARHLGIDHVASAEVVSEGGGRIVNGRGTLLVCRAVEAERNPQLDEATLERAYRAALGVTNVIWLNNGLGEDLHAAWGPIPYRDGDGNAIQLYGPLTTGGHLDELVRFAGPREIVLAQVTPEEAARDPLAALNYARCEEAFRILSRTADQSGDAFRIVRLPVPDVEYLKVSPSDRMYRWLADLDYPAHVPPFPHGRPIHVVKASSYANYLVTDELVVAPRYGNAAKDDAAAAALAAAFPGRAVVQIDPSALNYAGGGIHCCTQQQPAGECVIRSDGRSPSACHGRAASPPDS